MSKWNKWKLIHKETGLSFNQYRNTHPVRSKNGYGPYSLDGYKVEPVMLTSGALAVYVDSEYEPYMFFLDNKEWRVIMVPASPAPTE